MGGQILEPEMEGKYLAYAGNFTVWPNIYMQGFSKEALCYYCMCAHIHIYVEMAELYEKEEMDIGS